MTLANSIKRPLLLAKTHDYCPSGEPKLAVIFIHGIASDSSSFNGIIEHLEGLNTLKDVRFICFDLLGSGKSLKDDALKYDFTEQLEALDNSIDALKLDIPVVIVGHSMGTMIATRYIDNHRKSVKKAVLVSAPVYREEDVKNPLFATALAGFRDVVSRRNRELARDRAFENELKYIVSSPNNYSFLARLACPTTIIYGELDQIIASFNLPGLLKDNPNIVAIKTAGGHSVTREKYTRIAKELEDVLNEIK